MSPPAYQPISINENGGQEVIGHLFFRLQSEPDRPAEGFNH
jgi:hypothetical protein